MKWYEAVNEPSASFAFPPLIALSFYTLLI